MARAVRNSQWAEYAWFFVHYGWDSIMRGQLYKIHAGVHDVPDGYRLSSLFNARQLNTLLREAALRALLSGINCGVRRERAQGGPFRNRSQARGD
jgi:hypothetical protein